MKELLSSELDQGSLTSDSLDESNSNEDTTLFMNADSVDDYTLPMDELVAQSSGLFGCDVEVNTENIPTEEHNLQNRSYNVIANKGLDPNQSQERDEKLLLALEETALHFANYDSAKYSQSVEQKQKRKSSSKFKQSLLMNRKLKLRWRVFRTRGLYKCNLCPSEFTRRLLLHRHKMERHKKTSSQSLPKLNNKVRLDANRSGGEKTQISFNHSYTVPTPIGMTVGLLTEQSERLLTMNSSSSLISQEWLCCHHCDYKSHRYDFFNIHIERAHKKGKVGELLQEKGLDLTGSTNNRKRDSLIIHLRDSGSVAKSISGRLAVLLECETCHQKFNNRPSYNSHVLRHGISNWGKRSDYDYCANTDHSMKQNTRNMHPDKAAKCKPQDQTLKKAIKKRPLKVFREGYVKCNVCRKEVMEKKLTRHMLRHDPTKLVACAFCPYTSYREYSVKSHMLKFHIDKLFPKISNPISRSADNRRTSTSSGSNSDRSNSASPKGSGASVCQKDIPRSRVNEHLRSHKKDKWLRCNHCDYTTGYHAELKRHLESHDERNEKTNDDPSAWNDCPYCDFSTLHMSNIHTHIKNEHPELSVPESVQPTESSDGDDYGPSQMS